MKAFENSRPRITFIIGVVKLKNFILIWEKPLLAAFLAGLIFWEIAAQFGPAWRVSRAPYFNYLADALLHGQLSLRLTPPNVQDLSLYHGHYYLQWGFLPGLLAIPWVAIFGLQASDVAQSIVVAAANAAIFAMLLRQVDRRGWVKLSPVHRGLLVVFFSLGTAQAALPAVGAVWYLVQLESLTAALLAYLAAFSFENEKAFFWTGCAVAGVMLTRISAVFVAVFLVWYLVRRHRSQGLRRLLKACLIGLLPVVAAGLIMFAYNTLRFNNPFENGASYHLMSPQFIDIFNRYGYVNLHYIPVNFYLTYIYYPFITASQHFLATEGGNIFLLSPLFLAAIYSLWQDRADKDIWVLLLAVLLGNIPVLMIMAPGSVHFGPRYALDFALPMLMLTARGMRRWPLPFIAFLVMASVIQYLVGAVYMTYLFQR